MRLAFALLTALLAACGSLSADEYQAKVDAAKACGPGDTCVLSPPLACGCAQPVNERSRVALGEDALDVDCGDARVKCGAFDEATLACVDGRCTAKPAEL